MKVISPNERWWHLRWKWQCVNVNYLRDYPYKTILYLFHHDEIEVQHWAALPLSLFPGSLVGKRGHMAQFSPVELEKTRIHPGWGFPTVSMPFLGSYLQVSFEHTNEGNAQEIVNQNIGGSWFVNDHMEQICTNMLSWPQIVIWEISSWIYFDSLYQQPSFCLLICLSSHLPVLNLTFLICKVEIILIYSL